MEKPLKNMEPELYEVYSNKNIVPLKEARKYPGIYLRRVLKNGDTSKNITKVYTNSTLPKPVYFSSNKKDVIEKYKELVEKAIEIHKDEIKDINERIKELKELQHKVSEEK